MDEQLKEKLKKIKAIAFDGDGVLFTGRVFMGKEGEMMKERSHVDGHGISLLHKSGIKVVFVTAEKSDFLERVAEKLNVNIFTGQEGKNKVKVIDSWLKNNKIKWQECAAMGDDLTDYYLLRHSGFAVCPKQAEKEIKKISDYITERKGGDGAIRDFCNLILEARDIDPTTLVLR